MVEETAPIEEPKITGNYMARTNHRWAPPAGSKFKAQEDRDEIHEQIDKTHVSPAQMYSTDSGRMYHAGAICIVIVGLPARGKTNLSIGLCRYLRWLGVRANLFHYGDYRRKKTKELGTDFLSLAPESKEAALVRATLRKVVIDDMCVFFEQDKGQIAIYDAVNGISTERRDLVKKMEKHNVRTVFIESDISDEKQLQVNINDATESPDYQGWDKLDAVEDYTKRVDVVSKTYQPMSEKELTWVRTVNFGQTLYVNELKHDFLTTKIIFYLMNSRIRTGSIFFARCSNNKLKFKSDPPLSTEGKKYMQRVNNALIDYYKTKKGYDSLPSDLEVWTSTRTRTMQAAQVFKNDGLVVKPRPEMTQLNPGDAEGLSDLELAQKYPTDHEQHSLDPYHHRYPRAESYHDLALKLEPLILEAGRSTHDVLIVADETVIRVFYGYLMASSSTDIPFLKFPQNEIIEITYNAYANKAYRTDVPGVIPEGSK